MAKYRVDVKRPIEFLGAVLDAFCGQASVSFEGDLSVLRQGDLPEASQEETACLRRQTKAPRQDFLVVPLTRATVARLHPVLARVGLRQCVLHVQVEKGGVLVFGAYDQFHPECVWVSDCVDANTLKRLREEGILRSYVVE